MTIEVLGRSVSIVVLLSPVICGLIGWLTNYLAVKMLFHPRNPLRIGPLTIQGVFPKRQSALAEGMGHMVEKNLINHDDLQKILRDPSFHDAFHNTAARHIDSFLDVKLTQVNPMVKMFLTPEMSGKIKTLLLEEMDGMLPELMEAASTELENRLVFRDVVRQKVENLSSAKVEEILLAIMSKEFRFIEVVGGILGFVVGLAQLALLFFAA